MKFRMCNIVNVDLFMNGILLSESVDGIPIRAIMAFIKRMMLDIMEPSSRSEHICSNDCKDYCELIIGGVDDYGPFEKCVPK